MHGINDREHFTFAEKLPSLNSNFATAITEESDADDYYPFVIGHGSSFKVIDPKVYKQLRRHNSHQKVSVKLTDSAKKSTISSCRVSSVPKTKTTSISDKVDDGDEYCELSPIAKAPPIKLSSLRTQSSTQTEKFKCKAVTARVSSFERRLYSDCYFAKTKTCLVESQPSSPSSRPTSTLVDTKRLRSERDSCLQWTNEKKEPLLCGVEADEFIDYASCMCCVKGIFYHCTKDSYDEGQLANEPCSCGGPISSCAPRWGFLALLSLFIPCMWCYLPAVGCKKAVTTIKNKGRAKKHFKFNSK
ncbi:protein sprouty homolog 2-like [Montipora capricornis]|uniref:protein sprouty homolog 2-like n=1 Tax=Montipora foliosa TaxID=591990 RepID=UPI0035F173CF